MDLPAGVISISTPSLSSGVVLVFVFLGLGRFGLGVAATEHGARAGVLAHEPQRAAAAREEVADDLLEVLGRGLERLLEGFLDAPVGVLDELGQLTQRGLHVLAHALELLHVLERFLVLGLRERVDRAELLTAALQALDRLVQVRALVVAERLLGRLRLQPELRGEPGELGLDVLRVVAGALRLDLAAGDGLAALTQLRVDA